MTSTLNSIQAGREGWNRYFQQFCSHVNNFDIMEKIGRGKFGEVFQGRLKITNQIVAMKKIVAENGNDGLPLTALREINILHRHCHPNVVRLLGCCRGATSESDISSFYLVFEYCDDALKTLIENPRVILPLPHVKSILLQILKGLDYLHSHKVLHRDIKPGNILIALSGLVKISDLGSATELLENQPNNLRCRVGTLFYRSPELLLGDTNYGPAVDMWGLGCTFGELLMRRVLFCGTDEHSEIVAITKLCGSISPKVWPNVVKLPLYNELTLPMNLKRQVKGTLWRYQQDFLASDLLDQLLTFDPTKRLRADEALSHHFFYASPLPTDPSILFREHKTTMQIHLELRRRLKARITAQAQALRSVNKPCRN